ncbi:MAG: hypothetical protein ACI3XG_06270 [Faecousia sp.]
MFTIKHFIWLGLCALAIAFGLTAAEKKRINVKTAGLVMSCISILSESCKMMTHLLPSPLGGFALDPNALPFHLCSMQIFIVFYITFAKPSSTRDKVISFSVPAALLGGIMAMLIPTDGVDFLDPLAYQCFVYHAGLVWLALYFLRTKQVNMGRKAYGRNLLILLCLAGIMIYVNGAFFAYGTNFMFLTRPPMEGLPILNLNHGWYVYFLSLAALAVVLMTMVHLPFMIAERRGQTP